MVAYAEIEPDIPRMIQKPKEPSVIEPIYFILFFIVAMSLVALRP